MQMRNSKMTEAWVAEACRLNPIQPIMDPKTGQPTGAIRTCPVRLAFVHVFQPAPPQKGQAPNPNAKPKYMSALLFPPGVDSAPLANAYYAGVRTLFPQHIIQPDTGAIYEPYPLHSPFRMQDEKLKFNGYTPGGIFLSCSTRFRPPVALVTDPELKPIEDQSRVYAGVWAICALNVYSYGVNPSQPKKGVGFGLMSILICQDDERIDGAGAADPSKVFANVNVNANFSVAAAFGTAQQPGVPAGAILPSAGAVPPPGGFPTQALPVAPATADDLW